MTRSRLCPALVFGLVATVVSQGAEVSTLTGKKYQGDLAAVDRELVRVATPVGTVAVPVKDMFEVDFGNRVEAPAKGGRYDEIELTDGSVIRCGKFAFKPKAVVPEFLPGPAAKPPAAEVPMGCLFGVLRGADDPQNRDEWRKLLAARGKRDLFVIKQAQGFNPLPGTILGGGDAGDALTFEKEDGGRVTYKLSRVTGGLVFNQPPRGEVAPTVCKLFDVFGNVLYATDLKLAGDRLTVTTVAGATFAYESLAAVSKLDFSQGNITYLSDLSPAVTAPKPEPGEPHFTYLRDKNQENLPLKLDGTTYAKGLWVFPDTTLTYKLGGEFREFKALAGVDESIQIASSMVKLTVEGDGKVLFAGTVSRKDKAKPLTLDVKGVKELRISVEQDALSLGNQINLAQARLQK